MTKLSRRARLNDAPSSLDELRFELASDLPAFLYALWESMHWADKAPLSDIEIDIAAFAAGLAYDPITKACTPDHALPKYRGVLAPRWSGKTHLGPVAVVALWRLLRDHDRKVLIPSASEPNALATLHLIRSCIDRAPFLQHLTPRKAARHRDNDFAFDAGPCKPARQPSVSAIGLYGQLEGNHVHGLAGDDIETDANSQTLKLRQQLRQRVTEFKAVVYGEMPTESLDPPTDRPEIVYFGTYHDEDSLYTHLASKGYLFRTWPITVEPGDKHLNLAPIIANKLRDGTLRHHEPCWPHRFGSQAIAERRVEGARHFNLQHKLVVDLASHDKHPLKLRDLIVSHVDRDIAPARVVYGTANHAGSTALDLPTDAIGEHDLLHAPAILSRETARYSHTIAAVDPAGVGSDKTGLAVVAHLHGMFHVKCVRGLQGGLSTASLDSIARLLRDHNATDCFYERNIDAHGAFRELLTAAIQRHALPPNTSPAFPQGWNCSVVPVHSTGQKETRILSVLEPVLTSHRLVIHQPEIELNPPFQEHDPNNELQRQLTRLTRERNALPEDGKIDALAIALSQLTHLLALDPASTNPNTSPRFASNDDEDDATHPTASWINAR